jgi:hypothetical protein
VGLLLWRWRPGERLWLPVVAGLGYLAAVSATAHKEDRFLYPTLILLTVAGTPAFVAHLAQAWARPATRALLAATLAAGSLFFVLPSGWAPQRQEQFQLEVEASRTATGFLILNEGVWGSGGLFYLGRDLPFCTCDEPEQPCFQAAARDARFNRALYWSSGVEPARDAHAQQAFEAAGFRLSQRRGQALLFER